MKKTLKIIITFSIILLFATIFNSYVLAEDGKIIIPQSTPSDNYPWYISYKLNSDDNYLFEAYEKQSDCEAAYKKHKGTKNYFEIKECKNFTNKEETAGSINDGNKEIENLNPQKEKNIDTTTYNLLAPIGELKSVSSMNISDYFSLMLKIIIGLCAVSAVVMIVIGGVQYMGKDSIFGKAEAKGRIINAIFGLIIALGSYALLNTINPDLLGVKGFNIKQVEGVIDLEYENEPWEGSSFGNNKNLCPQGFYNIDVPWGVGKKKTLNVCNSIKKDVIDLLNAAKSKGIMLSGSGSRTTEEQQDLRIQHGCPDPKTPSSKCNPPTARPGYSMHETGMAIDFKCNNIKMRSGDDCFNWLKDNAYKYKLYNLKSEPWHWSTNGK